MSEEQPGGAGTDERRRRWRLVTGGDEPLPTSDQGMDKALSQLYDKGDEGGATAGAPRTAGLGSSSPKLARWLGDIRSYFPSTVVQVMQRDAIERHRLHRLMLEPEMLASIEPDVHLVGTLVALADALPAESRETARQVVREVVEAIEKRIGETTRSALRGSLDRASRTHRPRHADIDWNRTVRANLKHYQPEHRTVVPERLIGYGRRSTAVQREIVLAIDQSGSMAESVVYASVFASVLASIRSVRTQVVAFDTEVVDLTDQLEDPVDLLFGIQLGGGTDINRAVGYCSTLITQPQNSIFVLISDLYEGGDSDLLTRMGQLRTAGVQCVALLALADSGAPAYDHDLAAQLVELDIPAFACTPDAFPDLLAAAVRGADLRSWGERYRAERSQG